MYIFNVLINLILVDMVDFKYFNDCGYEKMVEVWFSVIFEVDDNGWLEELVVVDVSKF